METPFQVDKTGLGERTPQNVMGAVIGKELITYVTGGSKTTWEAPSTGSFLP
jgi:hypothetical protein